MLQFWIFLVLTTDITINKKNLVQVIHISSEEALDTLSNVK